jgi:hypothetical protein
VELSVPLERITLQLLCQRLCQQRVDYLVEKGVDMRAAAPLLPLVLGVGAPLQLRMLGHYHLPLRRAAVGSVPSVVVALLVVAAGRPRPRPRPAAALALAAPPGPLAPVVVAAGPLAPVVVAAGPLAPMATAGPLAPAAAAITARTCVAGVVVVVVVVVVATLAGLALLLLRFLCSCRCGCGC